MDPDYFNEIIFQAEMLSIMMDDVDIDNETDLDEEHPKYGPAILENRRKAEKMAEHYNIELEKVENDISEMAAMISFKKLVDDMAD